MQRVPECHNTFFAIIIGLSDVAVSRLTQTWSKVPEKIRKTFSGVRITDWSDEESPELPNVHEWHQTTCHSIHSDSPEGFIFLLIHGNQTFVADLINFEKMVSNYMFVSRF